jgi:hypothetical protein
VFCGPRRSNDEKYIKAFAEDIIRWGNYHDALSLEEYYNLAKVTERNVNNWKSSHEFLQEAMDRAKSAIGVRIEKEWLRTNFTPKASTVLHHYLPRCKASDIHHAKLRKDSDDKPTNITVNLKDFSKKTVEKKGKDE